MEERAETSRLEVRARAIETRATLGLPEQSARVMAALDDPSPLLRMIAARAIARAGTLRHRATVVERLTRFDEWNPRFLASLLAGMGSETSGSLRERLADDGMEPWARAVTA